MEALFNWNAILISLDQNSDNCKMIAIHIVAYDSLSFDLDRIRKYQTESFSFHPLKLLEKSFHLDNLDRYRNVLVYLQLKHTDYPISFQLCCNSIAQKKTTKKQHPSLLAIYISYERHQQISSPDDWFSWIYANRFQTNCNLIHKVVRRCIISSSCPSTLLTKVWYGWGEADSVDRSDISTIYSCVSNSACCAENVHIGP